MNNMTFNEFCHKYCDRLYNPALPQEAQCTGYIKLKKMVAEQIGPASLEEIVRWENNPSINELFSEPDIKYMRFLHPLLREYIVGEWETIKTLKI